jgi:cobalt/nickel transport system permease protein
MHISEGVLSPQVFIAGYAAAAGLTAWGIAKTPKERIPKTAVMGAAFFVSSLIHFRLGVTSIHLTLIGLMGIMLGLSSIPAILIGLFLQAILFQHGGLTTLGVNTVIFSLPAIGVAGAFSLICRRIPRRRQILALSGAALTGIGILTAAFLVFLLLRISGEGFTGIAYVFSIGHALLAVIEGVLTFFIIQQLLKRKPQLISSYIPEVPADEDEKMDRKSIAAGRKTPRKSPVR